ncbi:T9SS type A sorting domain-containing protein [Luteibaculum oceani]|uniref:T9SS type A sorting domain-containing protein n=1 Tax=Luteibaculum oceani TaxID=1294296 RepID=A0A5C6V9G9_9FLAO|nr:T9SS type A sorting domain-containing protein [Luteibaculum oceani]TXC81797.1 T9SS type A sorting domain-containing protein [Luteibaculum oceani]
MKKIYALGVAALISGGAFAQSAITKDLPHLPGKVGAPVQTEQGALLEGREARAMKMMDVRKTPGDVVASFNFDDNLEGWYPDTLNIPDSVPTFYRFEHQTDSTLDGPFSAQAVNSQSPKGFAGFEVDRQTQENGIPYITERCWAGLTSPVMDLSSAAAEKDELIMYFHNVYRHCCSFILELRLDISVDGGQTFPGDKRINIFPFDGVTNVGGNRNVRSGGDNFTIVPIGTEVFANEADLSNVVFRFTWDGSVVDANGQTSNVYYWGLDDISIEVASTTDLLITDADYGDPVGDWDYRKMPEQFIDGYPMRVEVTNNGSDAASFRAYVELTNDALGKTVTDSTDLITIGGFSDTAIVYPTFTSYDINEDWLGEWSITHYIKADASTPDKIVNSLDTFQVVPIEVTTSLWSHARDWTGGVTVTREHRDGARPGMGIAQAIELPPNVSTARLMKMRAALHDTIAGDEDSRITVPNQMDFVLEEYPDFNINGTASETFLTIYFNESTNEVNGQIEINDQQARDTRLTKEGMATPVEIIGDAYNVLTDEPFTDINREDDYHIVLRPNEPINVCAAGDNGDNGTRIYGNYGSAGEQWWIGDAAVLLDLFVEPLDKHKNIADNEKALSFQLAQNSPNPFNGVTEIAYNLETAGNVSFRVMDITGKIVENRASERMNAGKHVVSVDASNYNSGIYFYTLTVDGESITKKMIVNK